MAHIAKATSKQVPALLAHDERTCENHTNEKIQPEKSKYNHNYIIKPALQRYNDIIKDTYVLNRKDVNTLVMITVTLPKDVKKEDVAKFFNVTSKFLSDIFTLSSTVSSIIHFDETTPHLHFKAVPRYWNEKKGRYQVSFDKVCPRAFYRDFHKNLSKFVEISLGYPVSIENGATKSGNKSIEQLKNETKIKETEIKLENLKSKVNNLTDNKNQLEDKISNLQSKEIKTKIRINDLTDNKNQLEDKIEHLNYNIINLQSAQSQLNSSLRQKQEEAEEQAEAQARETTQKLHELQQQLTVTMNTKSKLDKQNADAEAQAKEIAINLQSAQSQLVSVKNDIASANEKMQGQLSWSFKNSSQIVISEEVSYIPDYAFKNCKNLKHIVIPNSVQEIGDSVFWGCKDLTIHTPRGSQAHRYAVDNDINVEVTDAPKKEKKRDRGWER